MPTPTGPRSSLARDGTIAGLNWADFTKQFQNVYTGTGMDSSQGGGEGSGLAGTGAGNAYGTANIGQLGGPIARWTNNGTDVYRQLLSDGTENDYTQGDGGALVSANNTTNNDSWWDSTGIPLLVAAGFGGALGAAGAFGGAAGAAGSAAGDSALGGAAGDLGAAGAYYPAADIGGGFLNVGADLGAEGAAGAAAGGAEFGGVLPGVAITGTAAPALGGLTVGEIGAGAAGLGGLGSAAASWANPEDSFIQPTNAAQTTQEIANSGNNLVSGGSASTNPFSSISNILGGNGTAGDYWSLASGVGSLANGLLGSHAANSAANAQTQAANNANQLAAQIYANNTAMAKPFVDGGTSAFNQQSNLNGLNGSAAQAAAVGQFHTDPGYQFAFDQGQRAVQSSAAASGGLYSGRAAKDLTQFGQGQADQQYGNYYNRLSGQAQLGQAAAAGQAANGNNYSATYGSNQAAIGNAQAAGTIGSTNAITGGISQLLNGYSQNQLLNLLKQNQNGYYGG